MEQHYQVVVVGGGPVGAALALDLGLRGVSVALVERYRRPRRIPKGQNLTQRTLEHFYFWGTVDKLRAARLLPPGYPIGGVTAYGNLMSEYWFAPAGREIVRSYYFQDNERLPQYLTEEVLRARLAQLPNVSRQFGRTATAIEQDARGVRVTTVESQPSKVPSPPSPYTGADGRGFPPGRVVGGGSPDVEDSPVGGGSPAGEEQVQTLQADYVVGCDGARSMVREQLGIDRGGADFDERMVLAVFRSRELHDRLKRFPDRTTYRVLHPDLKGYWQFFGRIDVGEGWFFHAPVPRDTTPDTPAIHALIERAAGFPFNATYDHVGYWDLRIAVASTYRVGRAFIAGDACHSHPPYGGFGLNSGLEDAVNLSWKLAAVLQGWGSEALLDSYGEERRPIFVETGEAMIAGGIESDRAFLERYTPERDRAAFEQAWRQLEATSSSQEQSYEPHYEGSSVVLGPAGATCSIHGNHSFAAQAGHHLAPQPLSSGKNVFEELGPGFTLLAFDAEPAAPESFSQAAAGLSIPLKVVCDTFAAGRAAYGQRLILVRPDQYVVWTANEPPPNPSAILRHTTGNPRG